MGAILKSQEVKEKVSTGISSLSKLILLEWIETYKLSVNLETVL